MGRKERFDASLLFHPLTLSAPRFKRCNKACLCYVTEDFGNKKAMSNNPRFSKFKDYTALPYLCYETNCREMICETCNCRAELKLSANQRAVWGVSKYDTHTRAHKYTSKLVRGFENSTGK